jgi:hypothetical protein
MRRVCGPLQPGWGQSGLSPPYLRQPRCRPIIWFRPIAGWHLAGGAQLSSLITAGPSLSCPHAANRYRGPPSGTTAAHAERWNDRRTGRQSGRAAHRMPDVRPAGSLPTSQRRQVNGLRPSPLGHRLGHAAGHRKNTCKIICLWVEVAEREGFEPPIRLPVCRISSAVRSTTLPPLRGRI